MSAADFLNRIPLRYKENSAKALNSLEARAGVEPTYTDLQSCTHTMHTPQAVDFIGATGRASSA